MTKNQRKLFTEERIEKIYALLKKSQLALSDIEIIKNNESICLEIINEALTHTSSNSFTNHERLEFHGDAVLRLAATEYIQSKFPRLEVGERSALRSQLVSDEWLAQVGNKIGIKETMVIAPKALKDLAAIETICAEGTEALIGALYECLKSISSIQNWLVPHWDIQSKKVLTDPHKQNAKSALQEWAQGEGLNKPIYQTEEVSKIHGDLKRFYCTVLIEKNVLGKGSGSSIKKAEKEAASEALKSISIKQA